MSIYDIIQELNQENGSNYKMDVLRKHKDNELLKRVLKMTYDKVDFTYGISQNTWDINDIMIGESTSGMGSFDPDDMDLDFALDILGSKFATREWTGHDARDAYRDLLYACDYHTSQIVMGIVNRDLRINMGRSNINKVFKGLIVKPVYMRCGLFGKGKSKINPTGSFVQLKADGTYREFTVENSAVLCNSRSGEVYEYPHANDVLEQYRDGHYIGELTVVQEGKTLDRATGNGLINSYNDKISKAETDEEKRAIEVAPNAVIVLELWDYVTLEEYTGAANKVKGTTPYHERLAALYEITGYSQDSSDMPIVQVIETHQVDSVEEALAYCTSWMEQGLEGAIWKDRDAIFRDGTSPHQEKMKIEFSLDVRITGFKPGTPGTKREGRIGSIEFATDDGRVKGYASGFSDQQLDDMDARREEILGAIMTVTCSDITRGRSNEHYALSHPRFVELRNDKTETDTLERIFETKQMAMDVGA
jgi:DNA ligase-1